MEKTTITYSTFDTFKDDSLLFSYMGFLSNIMIINSIDLKVNSLSADELNALYRKILTNNEFTDAGGAGLGFIEMARKTHQTLDFEFVNIDNKYSYFYLIIKVKDAHIKEKSNHVDLGWVKKFHKSASENELIVLHKGNITSTVVEPVVSMVDGNFKSKEINVQKLALNITLGIFENTSSIPKNLSKENDSIFLIANDKEKGKNIISIGNHINIDDVIILKQNLELLKRMDKEEQKKLYKKLSKEKSQKQNKSKIALSLINIAIECNNEFEYKFHKLSEKLSFYSFIVNI